MKKLGREKIIIFSLLFFITFLGAFLRLYQFSDWLHFELDQSRDVMFVSEAVRGGILDLPLLGPKASGTTLHLGPAYYYLEYLSALFFGDTPAGHALFVALFSILSIPLMFLVLKRFFNATISLGLTYLYSVSAYFVLYARFSWNPNVLPFFILAVFYSFFRATDKAASRPGRWFVAFGLLFAISTQLHFVAFVALPVFFLLAISLIRPRFSWKTWAAFFAVVTVVYFPVLVSEQISGGANTKAFFGAVSSKGDRKDSLANELLTNISVQSRAYALLLSGEDHIFLPIYKFKGFAFKKTCGDHCKKTSTYLAWLIIAFFLSGSGSLLYHSFKPRNNFAVLGSWFLSIFLVFTLLASNLAPRFYLLLIPLPFVFIGIMLNFIWKRNIKSARIFLALLLLFLSWENMKVLKIRFSELQAAATDNVSSSADGILQEPIRVTLEQQEMIAQYFFDQHEQNDYPVFLNVDPYWERSIMFLTEKKGAPVANFAGTIYLHGNSFIVARSKKGVKSKLAKYAPFAELKEKKQFGTLTVYALSPKPETASVDDPKILPLVDVISGEKPDISEAAKSGTVRITWRDVLSK